MASVQGDSGVTDFGVISSRPGFMLHAEIQGKQVLVPVKEMTATLGKGVVKSNKIDTKTSQYDFGNGNATSYGAGGYFEIDYTDEPELFNAHVVTYDGEEDFEDLSGLFVNVDQIESASVSYRGQSFELPTETPYFSLSEYVGVYVFPKIEIDPSEYDDWKAIEPVEGMVIDELFQIMKVMPTDDGWVCFVTPLYDEDFEEEIIIPVDYYDGFVLLQPPEEILEEMLYNGDIAASFAAGDSNIALGGYCLGEGNYTRLGVSVGLGNFSEKSGVAIGRSCNANLGVSVGSNCYVGDHDSTAFGVGLYVGGSYGTAYGKYNVDTKKSVVIGCGTGANNRKNCMEADSSGKVDFPEAIPSVNGGDLVVLGIVPPAAKPAFAGQIYLDANNKKLYVAKAATATTDWVAIN